MAIISALTSSKMDKFKYMWLRLDNKYKTLLKDLKNVCEPNSNFKQLRNLMKRASSTRVPTVPYIGLFLSDLTFVNEGAAKLKKLVQIQTKNDEKSATNSERQAIKAQAKKN